MAFQHGRRSSPPGGVVRSSVHGSRQYCGGQVGAAMVQKASGGRPTDRGVVSGGPMARHGHRPCMVGSVVDVDIWQIV
jgi:hypothetical protein